MAKKCGKKRKLAAFIAAAILSVCGLASAQSYPPEFAGARFDGSTLEIPIAMCMTAAENIPYSMPEMPPCDEAFWYGTFIGYAQASELALDFFAAGGRFICAAPPVWHERFFPWNPDVQAYARLAAFPEMPWVVRFEVITVDWSFEFGTYREGVFVFSGHPSTWWIVSDDYQYFEYNISPSDKKMSIIYSE